MHFVVSSGDGASLLLLAEGPVGTVANLVGNGMDVLQPSPRRHVREDGGEAVSGEEGTLIVGTIRFVGDQAGRRFDTRELFARAVDVRDLGAGQEQCGEPVPAVAEDVVLARLANARVAARLIVRPLYARPVGGRERGAHGGLGRLHRDEVRGKRRIRSNNSSTCSGNKIVLFEGAPRRIVCSRRGSIQMPWQPAFGPAGIALNRRVTKFGDMSTSLRDHFHRRQSSFDFAVRKRK